MIRPISMVAWCVAAVSIPAAALAQTSAGGADDAATKAKIHLGPLSLAPVINLTHLGIDTNVYNTADDPQRDFTATFVPRVDSWLRIGRARLTAKSSVELTYFQKSTNQRSVNLGQEGRMDLFLVHATPRVSAQYVTSSQRPNAEIDARVERTTKGGAVGSEIRLGPRAALDVEARVARLSFADERFADVDLAHELNRDSAVLGASVRLQLTPLTSFVLRSEVERDRFEFSTGRNADSLSVMPGFEFKPLALISGKAYVGYRRFNPRSDALSGFAGPIASVDLGWVMRAMTAVTVKVDRNIDYSFEVAEPYYVTTGLALSVTQSLFGSVDGVGRIDQHRLDYRHVSIAGAASPGARRDRMRSVGAGIGYRFGTGARIGFDVDYLQRHSELAARRFQGVRYGSSVTYGF